MYAGVLGRPLDSTRPFGMADVWRNMRQPITGFHTDELYDWVAELACGHFQHVRHDPPWQSRPWVVSASGRDSMLGYQLVCKKCIEGAPADAMA